MRGLIDAVGRGTNRIVDSCIRAGLPESIYSLHSGGFEVNFPMISPFVPNKRQVYLLKRINIGQRIVLADYKSREGKKIKERQAQEDIRQFSGTAGYEFP
ncbi:MAG: hypothetical protein ACE5D6_02900 [Candidatus Zixiibacteriota bacterium]